MQFALYDTICRKIKISILYVDLNSRVAWNFCKREMILNTNWSSSNNMNLFFKLSYRLWLSFNMINIIFELMLRMR